MTGNTAPTPATTRQRERRLKLVVSAATVSDVFDRVKRWLHLAGLTPRVSTWPSQSYSGRTCVGVAFASPEAVTLSRVEAVLSEQARLYGGNGWVEEWYA